TARNHLVQDDAQAENIATPIERLTLRLFGRHIADRAEYRVSMCHVCHRSAVGRRGLVHDELGDAEVQYLGESRFSDDNVGGLEIAMNDAGAVGNPERFTDVDRIADGETRRYRAAGDHV